MVYSTGGSGLDTVFDAASNHQGVVFATGDTTEAFGLNSLNGGQSDAFIHRL